MQSEKFKNKYVWDLSWEDIEFINSNLHMNRYVYAALSIYHKSRMPLNKFISLKKNKIHYSLIEPTEKLIKLSPYLGKSEPSLVRQHYTYYSYELFNQLGKITLNELNQTIDLLASLAYIPIIAEKNDNKSLWGMPVVRIVKDYDKNIFEMSLKETDINKYLKYPIFSKESLSKIDSEVSKIFIFMHGVMSSIMGMIENNTSSLKIKVSLENVEKTVLDFEKKQNFGNLEHYKNKGNIKNKGQIRYRNTLYLYGGNYFERKKLFKKSFDWYIKDIYFIDLVDLFGFHLTDMKTIERLICAYNIAPDNVEKKLFKDLIDNCMLRAFHSASDYAFKILTLIENTPGIDLSQERLYLKNLNKYYLYAGEACREVFFISLLYNQFIKKVKLKDIDYEEYFIIY